MNPTDRAGSLAIPVSEHDHRGGRDNASVTLLEYGDYECPACAQAAPVVEELRERFGDRLRFVYRHFPLAKIHPHAVRAAEAAESAGAQGLFWEMSRMLHLNYDRLDDGSLVEYAIRCGVNLEKFLQDMATHRHSDRVREDYEGGLASGVALTPTFFINGQRHDAAWSFDALLAELEKADLSQGR